MKKLVLLSAGVLAGALLPVPAHADVPPQEPGVTLRTFDPSAQVLHVHFTNKGRVYWLKIYNIPDAGTTGKGKNISSLISLQDDESVKAFTE